MTAQLGIFASVIFRGRLGHTTSARHAWRLQPMEQSLSTSHLAISTTIWSSQCDAREDTYRTRRGACAGIGMRRLWGTFCPAKIQLGCVWTVPVGLYILYTQISEES
jgi:hypothetical protein